MSQKVEMRDSQIKGAGKGIFALHRILKGKHVTGYKGYLMEDDEFQKLIQKDSKYQAYAAAVGDKVCLGVRDARIKSKLGQFANDHGIVTSNDDAEAYTNDAVKSNAVLTVNAARDGIVLISTRQIEAGEEIFLHYGIDYWIHKNNVTLDPELYERLKKKKKEYFDRL